MQELRQDLDPALVGHHHVHQDHGGLQLARAEDRVPRVAGLADDLDVVVRVQQQPQAGAHDGVVVDDEDADGLGHGRDVTRCPGLVIRGKPQQAYGRCTFPHKPIVPSLCPWWVPMQWSGAATSAVGPAGSSSAPTASSCPAATGGFRSRSRS